MGLSKKLLLILIGALVLGYGAKKVLAEDSVSALYVPLIGITSVPEPFALPGGSGEVTYHYAVKNFLREAPLTDVQVVDDSCEVVKFVTGDDNHDGQLDYDETWRYTCTVKLSETTQSTATATGLSNDITSSDTAYATVIVGSANPPPLVSIINITKVAYPLSLPAEGGDITFTYKVNNPGVVPLGGVSVTDDKCSAMSGKLGDTNGNNLLDINEVWIYTCTANLAQTTTNTAKVTAFANGLQATDTFSITVKVANSEAKPAEKFPETGQVMSFKTGLWGILLGLLIALIVLSLVTPRHKKKRSKTRLKSSSWFGPLALLILFTGVLGVAAYFIILPQLKPHQLAGLVTDELFGWKYPVADFPTAGANSQLAYSDIRDPGGVPRGLPVRLRIPVIGVNSAIEDAYITADGRMDVPAGSKNVAWFALGPHPGQPGSAVIGGHFGISNGVPFVFYKLDEVQIGDKVYVTDDNGDSLGFIVRKISLFDRNADATTVFTSHDGLAHLNLITCEGVWNKVNDTYPERRVVFAEAMTAEEAAADNPLLPATSPPPETEVSLAPTAGASNPLLEAARSLFTSPADRLFTSVLLLSIFFVSFNILWRRRV